MAANVQQVVPTAESASREQQASIVKLVAEALAKVHQRFGGDAEKLAKLSVRVPYIYAAATAYILSLAGRSVQMEHRRVANGAEMAAVVRTLNPVEAERVIDQSVRLIHGVVIAIYRLTDHLTYGAKYERQAPEAQLEALHRGGNLSPRLNWAVSPDDVGAEGEGVFVSVHENLPYHEEVERHLLPFCDEFKIKNRLTKDFRSKIIHSKFSREFDRKTGFGARALRAQMGEAYLGVSVERMRKEIALPYECGIGIRDAVDFIRANWGVIDHGSLHIACAADLVTDTKGEFTMVPVFGPHFGQLSLYAHPVNASDAHVGIATQFLPPDRR